MELADLIDLTSGERNSTGRLELVAEDRASEEEEEEEERNGQREETEKGDMRYLGKMKINETKCIH